MNDHAIVDLFLERNEDAIVHCDNKYGSKLRAFGNRITNDAEATEECVDDTYMRAWQSIPPTDPRSYLFAFLSKIMRTRCIDSLRNKTREKRGNAVTVLSDELTAAAPDPQRADCAAIKNELSALIEKFLLTQKEETRHVFVLRYFYMESVEDIAKRLYITEGKVKTVLKRTRDKMKLYLELYGYHA